MEENEFRATYHTLNEQRCPFEKAMNSRRCSCSMGKHFLLAGRDGFGCQSLQAKNGCQQLLALLRENARFTLGLSRVHGPLPHAKEIKVQVGGLLGLQSLVMDGAGGSTVEDVYQTIETALTEYQTVEQLPFDRILPAVTKFQGRSKRRKGAQE